jgi:hypothetical protein
MGYLGSAKDTIGVQMYSGKAIGMGFPTDGNKHNDIWQQKEIPVLINGKKVIIMINTYEDGSLISIEVGLPSDVLHLTASN